MPLLNTADNQSQHELTRRKSGVTSKSESVNSTNNPNVAQDDQHDGVDIMDQLSARMGSFQIAEDGQLRYFGATSNLHILHNGLSSLSRPPNRSVHAEGDEVLSRAGLDRQLDAEFEKHLENLYFRWEDPAIHVVDEEMYFMAQDAYLSGETETPFYSETLKNAM